MTSIITQVIARSLVILLVCVTAGIIALHLDSTGATMGTFSTGGIDLKIDSRSIYNGVLVPGSSWSMKNLVPTADKFFNYDDIKPGDLGCETISMHVKKGTAWLCLDFKNLKSLEHGVNEPESLIPDPNGAPKGELADNLQLFGWVDTSCDGKYSNNERILFGTSTKTATSILASTTYAIGDSKSGGQCKENQQRCASMCWCAGTLTIDMNTGKMSCDGSHLGNIAQTDIMTLDVSIRALESSGDAQFLCNPRPAPQTCKKDNWNQWWNEYREKCTPPPSCEKDKSGTWKDENDKNCKPKQYCEKDSKGLYRDELGKPCTHVPQEKNDCINGGWKQCKDDRGNEFKAQKTCTDYVDTHPKSSGSGFH